MEEKRTYKAGIILGITGIIFSVLFPAAAYGCSIPGIVMSAKKDREKYHTTAALVLNIIATAIAAANSITAVVITAKGFTKKRNGEF